MKCLFREDLYYRLNVFPLHIPPLRERRGDILPLAEMALAKHFNGNGCLPQLAACAAQSLVAHSWPGNVRELENVIQRSLILLQGAAVTKHDLVFEGIANKGPVPESAPAELQQDLRLREFQLIVDALREENGHRGAAATRLGISPRTLRYKLAKMREVGIDLPEDIHNVRRANGAEEQK